MKTYSVQALSWSAASDGDVVIVPEGFNWWALIFGFVWALWHAMWRTAIVLFVLGVLISAVGPLAGLTATAVALLHILVQVALGLWGNDLRRAALRRRGYVERAVVSGRNMTDAEHRYFSRAVSDPA